MSALAEEIQRMIQANKRVELFPAKVQSVDQEEYTCELVESGEENAPYYNVRLKPIIESGDNGVIAIPKVGSWVIAAKLGEERRSIAIILWGEIDKFIVKTSDVFIEVDKTIRLNGEALGGIVDWPKAVIELTKLSARVDVIYSALNAGTPSTASGGAPDGGAALISTIKSGLAAGSVKESWTGLENQKVKHG